MGTNGGVPRRRVEKLSELPLSERRVELSELVELLSGESPYVRRRAMELLAELSTEYPDAVAAEVDAIAELLDDPGLSEAAARTLDAVTAHKPESVSERLPLLVAVLDSGGETTVHITSALASISNEKPGILASPGVLDKLVHLLDADERTVRTNVTKVIGDVAAEEPGAVTDAGDQIRHRLTDSSPEVQRNAAYALGQLGELTPREVIEAFGRLCDLLDSDNDGVRSGAAFALISVTAGAKAISADAVESLLAQLRADHPTSRQQAAFVVAAFAADNPSVLRPHIWQLTRECVDTEPQVRRNLVQALATLEESFPEDVETARTEVSDALVTADISAAATDLEPAALRALADDEAAPETLRRAAREAAVLAGHDGSDGEQSTRPTTEHDTATECPDCGEVCDPDATFCPVCGTSLEL